MASAPARGPSLSREASRCCPRWRTSSASRVARRSRRRIHARSSRRLSWPRAPSSRGSATVAPLSSPSRICRLPPQSKMTLQHAAVVGRFFTRRELAALGDEGAEVDRALADLLRAELIREWARLPERQYVFKHALTRDAAYASLLGEKRRMLRARVARHRETSAGGRLEESAPLLAHHWREAEDWERALEHT